MKTIQNIFRISSNKSLVILTLALPFLLLSSCDMGSRDCVQSMVEDGYSYEEAKDVCDDTSYGKMRGN